MESTQGTRPASSDGCPQNLKDENGALTLSCCCGNPDCAHLQRNNAALETLERDVRTAAQLGQALLERHQSYIEEFGKERRAMMLKIEHLEAEKADMEAENGNMINENRKLLEQLDMLNKNIVDSDHELKGMASALESTRNEMQSLAHSAMRVAQLEDQVNNMEIEQVELQEQLELAKEDEAAAISRWKRAEYTLRHLENEYERLERDSREEHERHLEVIGRMERRRAVEKQLNTAAARLKGAAAATTSYDIPPRAHGAGNGNNVISSFVRDILQDNATLQAGIVELKGMLESSNEEVQSLRERMTLHPTILERDSKQPLNGASLGDELESCLAQAQPQAGLHVHHHHYHSPVASNTNVYMPSHRRQRRRRTIIAPNVNEPSNQVRKAHKAFDSLSSISTILSHTSATVPHTSHARRWASQSSASGYTIGSANNSPPSRETASIFSRMDRGCDSSRPTSPESSGVLSPPKRSHGRKTSNGSYRSIGDMHSIIPPVNARKPHFDDIGDPGDVLEDTNGYLTIPEEREDGDSVIIAHSRSGSQNTNVQKNGKTIKHKRSASHDSVLPSQHDGQVPSISDKSHQSQRSSAGMLFTSRPAPVLSETTIVADRGTSAIGPERERDPQYLLQQVALTLEKTDEYGPEERSKHRLKSPVRPKTPSASPFRPATPQASSSQQAPESSQKIGIGGWVLGKWGRMPLTSRSSRVHTEECSSSQRSSSSPPPKGTQEQKMENRKSLPFWLRPPGINQKGPVPGLRPPPKAPVVLEPAVDRALLDESLQE